MLGSREDLPETGFSGCVLGFDLPSRLSPGAPSFLVRQQRRYRVSRLQVLLQPGRFPDRQCPALRLVVVDK